MKTIIVDDDNLEIKYFINESRNVPGIEVVGKFSYPDEAIEYARDNNVEFALLDIEMPEMNGIELADKLREVRKGIIIVFATAHPSYTVDAFRKKADYILYKPYDAEDLQDAVDRAQAMVSRVGKRIYCRTFGRFDVFIDSTPVMFHNAKSKELFALCVSRQGAPVSAQEMIERLWPDYVGPISDCSTFRSTVKCLRDMLSDYGLLDAFHRVNNMYAIDTDYVDCDYFDFLNGDENAYFLYQHEFMIDYEWGEYMIPSLDELKRVRRSGLFKDNVK